MDIYKESIIYYKFFIVKHAYLIIAHKNDYTIQTLLRLLDSPQNDIFIHMDLKEINYREDDYISILKKSNIYFAKRTSIAWGGLSLVNVTLELLELAVHKSKNKYMYYHLLSGQDLPIKSQKFIHQFFVTNNGFEFVDFQSPIFSFSNRVRCYYFFQEKIGRDSKIHYRILNYISIAIQKLLRVNRNKNIKFQKGCNWFSITNDFAEYVIKKRNFIENVFKYTYIPDEIFLQTLLINSPFSSKIYHHTDFNSGQMNQRQIDWDRGSPYTYTIDDYDMLIKSPLLFARKFDCIKDKEIIDKITDYVMT